MIIARTFSKIAALAGMRLGYADRAAETDSEDAAVRMGSINALVKCGGVASLKDTAGRRPTSRRRSSTSARRRPASSRRYGYETIPSETNFFMVAHRPRDPAGDRGVPRRRSPVGRPFPPMTTHMRVSIGTDDDGALHDRVQGDFPAGVALHRARSSSRPRSHVRTLI